MIDTGAQMLATIKKVRSITNSPRKKLLEQNIITMPVSPHTEYQPHATSK